MICLFICFQRSDIHLCQSCTDSMTHAYIFWQQVKFADDKIKSELRSKESATFSKKLKLDVIEFIDTEHFVETLPTNSKLNVEPIDESSQAISIDTNRKIRKTKAKPSAETQETNNKIGVNIALPHFIITESDFDDERSFLEKNDNNKETIVRKIIKTLKPSAVIPTDLSNINELSISPLESDNDDDGQSIYKCSHCPKAFAAPYHLMIHMRKSHLCQYCLETFTKINDLYDHVKDVHRTFNCLLCDKEFQSNGNLRQHMRKNHSIFLPAHISLLNISDVNI